MGSQLSYRRRRLRFAGSRWLENFRDKLGETVITAIVTIALGSVVGYFLEDTAEAVRNGIIGAVVGAIGGPVLVASCLFVWKWLTAPAALWKQQEDRIQVLSEEMRDIVDELSKPDHERFVVYWLPARSGAPQGWENGRGAPVREPAFGDQPSRAWRGV